MRADLDHGGYRARNLSDGVEATDSATVGQIANLGIPLGIPLPYLGTTAPEGYFLCYGQAISRSTYAALFAILGTTYGPGDGSTTFNLPDLRGRTLAGKDDMGGASAARLSDYAGTTLGAAFGSQNHVLTTPQMPSHAHGVSDPGHSHGYSQVAPTGGIASGSGYGQYSTSTSPATTGITLQNTGGDGAHPNVQPTIITNWILRTS